MRGGVRGVRGGKMWVGRGGSSGVDGCSVELGFGGWIASVFLGGYGCLEMFSVIPQRI